MEINEKELEDMIFSANRQHLHDRGFRDCSQEVVLRQLNIGAYGVADLVSFRILGGDFGTTEYHITVYELKKDQIGIAALGQACRYISGIKSFIDSHFDSISSLFSFSIVLVGSSIETRNDFVFIADQCQYRVMCYEYSFGFYGLRFRKQELGHFVPARFDEAGIGDLPKLNLKDIYKKAYRLLISN